MKRALFLAILIGIALADFSIKPILCSSKDRSVSSCPKNFSPVLGVNFNGFFSEFKNRCLACKKSTIEKYFDLNTCFPSDSQLPCSKENKPVCMVSPAGKLEPAKNKCLGCNANKKGKYLAGTCPDL